MIFTLMKIVVPQSLPLFLGGSRTLSLETSDDSRYCLLIGIGMIESDIGFERVAPPPSPLHCTKTAF
jgi:hypothetical protein